MFVLQGAFLLVLPRNRVEYSYGIPISRRVAKVPRVRLSSTYGDDSSGSLTWLMVRPYFNLFSSGFCSLALQFPEESPNIFPGDEELD